jgi:uncharacterized protein involved in exopolysaccharide biosynthesis
MTVGTEQNSNVLTVSFRDTNPARAAEVTNALAQSFIDRQSNLLERPGVVDFLRRQTGQFDEEVEHRAALLREFSDREHTYSIAEERSLLLGRLSDLNAALSATRSSLAGKQGEKDAMSRQLALLQPVARSPFAKGFVDILSRDDVDLEGIVPSEEDANPLREDDTPPLLMIKMFQEVMTSFRLTDSQIDGLRNLAEQQKKEIEGVDAELARLASNQGEYERLKRNLDLATFNAETFAKRTVEEQIESDLLEAKLSNVRVIQPATPPLEATSPKSIVYAAFGVAMGGVLGVAAALAAETYRLNRPPRSRRGAAVSS